MGKLRVLNSMGHTEVAWDVKAGDQETQAAVKEAEQIFQEAVANSGMAFKVEADGQTQRIREFSPEAEQIIIVPRAVGG